MDTYEFERIDANSVQILGVSSDSSGHIRFEFLADRVDTHSFIYKVHPIKYWVNLTTEAILMEYSGDPYILYNSTSDCVRGLRSMSRNDIDVLCTDAGSRQGRFDSWITIKIGNPWEEEDKKTQVIESWSNAVVYCIGDRITMLGETHECPAYPFPVNPTIESISIKPVTRAHQAPHKVQHCPPTQCLYGSSTEITLLCGRRK